MNLAPWRGRPLRWNLVCLGIRRGAPPAIAVPSALLLAVVALLASPPAETAAAWIDAAGARRQAVWSVFCLLLLPLLVFRAANIADSWRTRDADWCASTSVGPSGFGLSMGLGAMLSALLLWGVALLAGEAGSAGARPAFFVQREIPHAALLLPPGAAPAEWTLEALRLEKVPAGARIELHATAAPGSGPSADLVLTLRGEGAKTTRRSVRIDGPRSFRVPLPGGAFGALRVRFERAPTGALLAIPSGSLQLLLPAASPRLAGLALGLRVGVLLASVIAIAAGLGAWMRPHFAAPLALALVLPGVLDFAPVPLPGTASLLGAFARTLEGTVPAAVGAGNGFATCIALAFGMFALLSGLSRGRGSV